MSSLDVCLCMSALKAGMPTFFGQLVYILKHGSYHATAQRFLPSQTGLENALQLKHIALF